MRLAARTALVLTAVVLGYTSTIAQCPTYTHKDDVVVGNPGDLPNGWLVYRKGTPGGGGTGWQNGLFRSPVNSFAETVVTGTSGDSPTSMDISPDGEWIVYLSGGSIYLVKSTGGSRTEVPYVNFNVASLGLSWTGFYRNSPNGLEIFYHDFNWAGQVYLCAIPVDLSGDTPAFGTARMILESQPPNSPGYEYALWIQSGSASVWGDQIFGLFQYTTKKTLNGFAVIPDGGSGIATFADFYQFTQQPAEDYWGCGQTMSHDGLFCASNSANVGDTCVPNKSVGMVGSDHKGIYITRFLRAGETPSMAIDDQIMDPTYGISINWCPEQYRVGDFSQIDFTNWNFSNSNQYLAGVLKGSAVESQGFSYGIWVVHWETSTWTQVNPNTTSAVYDEPALYFPGLSSVTPERRSQSPAQSSPIAQSLVAAGAVLAVPSNATTLRMFDMQGRETWSTPLHGAQQVTLPPHLRHSAMVVRFE